MKKIIALVLISLLASCGGGGGGSSSSNSGSSSGVRVMHAAIDAAPFELYSSLNPGSSYQISTFVEPIRYARVPQGEQIIELRRARTNSPPAISTTINYQGGRQSILLYGSLADGGLKTVTLNDGLFDLGGIAAVRVVNGLQNSPAVVIRLAGRSSSPANYGAAGEYMLLEPGNYPYTIASGNAVIESGSITVNSGRSYSVLLAGRMHYFSASSVYED
jgi:hypothetical protein